MEINGTVSGEIWYKFLINSVLATLFFFFSHFILVVNLDWSDVHLWEIQEA